MLVWKFKGIIVKAKKLKSKRENSSIPFYYLGLVLVVVVISIKSVV